MERIENVSRKKFERIMGSRKEWGEDRCKTGFSLILIMLEICHYISP